MEHHEGVYEQIEVNNTSQAGNEFLPQQLVQEIVVQNLNDQGSADSCEMSGIEIILPSDCINIQEQCNSSNIIICNASDLIGRDKQIEITNMQQEPSKDQSHSQANIVEEHISSCSESLNEQKLEEYIIQNQTAFHPQHFDINSGVTIKPENANKEDIGISPPMNVNILTDNQSVNNDDNTLINSQNIEKLSDVIVKSVIESESNKVLENLYSSEISSETLIAPIQTSELMEDITVSSIKEVITDIVNAPTKVQEVESENCLVDEKKKEEAKLDSNLIKEDTDSVSLSQVSEKIDSQKKLTEIVVESTNDLDPMQSDHIQSDDVAVLTEYMEYDVEEDKVDTEHKVASTVQKDTDAIKKDVAEEVDLKGAKELAVELELENHNEDELDLHLSADQSTENHRKVIQDIFDDWQDENGEEEVQSTTTNQLNKEPQDLVEMELQNLLNEEVQQEVTPTSRTLENSVNNVESSKNDEPIKGNSSIKPKTVKVEKSTKALIKSPKPISNSTPSKDQGQSPKNSSHSQSETKKHQSPRPGVKVPGLHLTSQIASTAEVNEVLKERLREKQKDLSIPKTADIVFVKKITQRLSSQLSAAAINTVVPPLSLTQSQQSSQNESSDSEKTKSTSENLSSLSMEPSKSSTDNKELLAILEGDVDPDWSNLKPHGVLEENNKATDSHSTGSKLDPAVERELALKQLLELPSIPTKKSSSSKQAKQTKRSGKSTKDTESRQVAESDTSKEIISLGSSGDDSPKKDKTPKQQKENNSHNARNSDVIELSIEESRSGRKRKLTEKAREHELTVKRQKVFKKFTSDIKKASSEETSKENDKQKSDTKIASPKVETKVTTSKVETTKTSRESSPSTDSKQKQSDEKQQSVQPKTPSNLKGKTLTPNRRSKMALAIKKDAPIAKRKLAVKNMMRQKKIAVTKAKSAVATETSTPNKSPAEKSANTASTVPKTKKSVSEIDRLLQDEGVVNLLYDVEQPDSRKRLVPITKSHKKIMDVDKAERELKLRTKLVRNAVLRLRNSSSSSAKISPRSRRNASVTVPPEQPPSQQEKKTSESKSPEPLEFIIPAKIRNAADASRIIRRHSSSSFSSTSASPRVSIDQPPESLKIDDPEVQTKSKRKLSQDSSDKLEGKKGKKKSIPKSESESKEKSEKSPSKKDQPKKVMTRSNTATPPAAPVKTAKNKKTPKSRSSAESSPVEIKSPPKNQEELSACLAEAVTALLPGINASSRSSGSSTNRKKGSTSAVKATDDDKVETKKVFSNKEISVRYHGHLVQLILTPSTPVSGIRNAITIQVMNELCEALSILNKDDDCRVVLFTSTGTSFCEGLEVSNLLHSSKEERKARAEEMAKTVKEFIRCLASFNKPLVAGVQGAAIGLGVTMLPLFDLVIASDKATFSTPYSKLGQIAEGAAVLTLSHSIGSAVTNELLLGGRTLTASEALRAGLVTRVLWPDRFQGELLPSLKTMSEQSAQSMEATKALLRHGLRQKLELSLESESLLLVQHWCSSECQEAIKVYIEEKGQ